MNIVLHFGIEDIEYFPSGVIDIGKRFLEAAKSIDGDPAKIKMLISKIENYALEVYMTLIGIKTTQDIISKIYSGNDMEKPAMFGEDKFTLLFNLESMIMQARSTLDLLSSVISSLITQIPLTWRVDSFNDLIKKHR